MWIESTIALKFLRDGRAQTTLILVGIAVGVAVIVFISALVTGLQQNIVDRTLGTQPHIRIERAMEANQILPVAPGTLQLLREDKRPQRLRSINNWQQVVEVLDSLPEVVAVAPVVSGPAFARRNEAFETIALIGIDLPRYEKIIPVTKDIVAGEFRVGAGDGVIGTILAENLGVRVGDKIRLETGNKLSTVINVTGIFELGVRDLDSRYVYLDLKQGQALTGLPGGATEIDVKVRDIFAADKVAERIRRLTGLKAESWMETNRELMNALRSQSMSTTMISLFVAVSVALGIASVLSVSVVQRTREIGILRAMGTSRQQMLGVFLIQGALLGLVGSLVGAFAGWGLVWIFNNFGPGLFYIPVSPSLIPAAMLLATLTGVLSAAVPAQRAAKLNPVAAIRYV